MVGLFGEVSWFGKVIVFILMGFSVVSWAMILLKYQFLRRSEKESHAFLVAFRKTKNIEELFKQADAKKYSPLATLFVEGYRKAESIIKTLPDGKVTEEERPLISQEIERSLKINTQDEIMYMERYLAFLGTTGTVGPLLGLLARSGASWKPSTASGSRERAISARLRRGSRRRSSTHPWDCSWPSRR